MRAVISALAVSIALISNAQADQIWLTMDQVRPLKLEKPAEKIVIGNPAIADVTVQDDENILLFGKAPGLTNIYIFDENGETLDNLLIRVRSTSGNMLTFNRGISRTTYNCTDSCEATITVGDDPTVFSGVTAQVNNKFQQATQAANNRPE